MKRKDIQVFKLTHNYLEKDKNIFIKTEIPEEDLLCLIKILQRQAYKDSDILQRTPLTRLEAFNFSPSEMQIILLENEAITAFPTENDLLEMKINGEYDFDFIEENLYDIWQRSTSYITDKKTYDRQMR